MAGLQRARDDARRLKRKGSRAQRDVFATMRSDAVLRVVLTQSKHAVRVWWLANSVWTPGRNGLVDGRAVLPMKFLISPAPKGSDRKLAEIPSHHTVSAALAALHEAGELLRLTHGTRPRGPGGAAARAAEFAVPSRHGENAPSVPWLSNVRRPQGKIRQHVMQMRLDAAQLSAGALCLLLFSLAQMDRDRDGGVVDHEPFALPAHEVAGRLSMSSSTLHAACQELLANGRIAEVERGRGRRPSTFRLLGPYVRFRGRGDRDPA